MWLTDVCFYQVSDSYMLLGLVLVLVFSWNYLPLRKLPTLLKTHLYQLRYHEAKLLPLLSTQTNGGWQDAPTPSSVTSPTEGPGSVHSDTSN